MLFSLILQTKKYTVQELAMGLIGSSHMPKSIEQQQEDLKDAVYKPADKKK